MYTAEEFAVLESYEANSSLSTKTPVALQDGSHQANTLTFVLDFKESSQGNTSDIFGNVISSFDVSSFGFTAGQFNALANAVLAEVDQDYFGDLVGTVAGPAGQDLAIDFIIGNIGTAPAGLTNYYFVQIGTGTSGPHSGGTLGVAGGSVVRNTSGSGPNFGIVVGDVVASVFTDAIQPLSGLTPSNALSSGNLGFTTHAVSGTLSHEIGHTLSLSHINKAGSTQPSPGASPIMGTGALDTPNQDRIQERQFSLSGVDGQNGNAPRQHVLQLKNAVGLHSTNSGAISVTTSMSDTALKAGETSLMTFTFSEAVTGFTNSDLKIANGTLTAVASTNGGVTWTATFTPKVNISDTTNVISLNLALVKNLAGNAGVGTTSSLNYTIDTRRPTVKIKMSDTSLTPGETSLVTFTFSEAVTGFSNTDLLFANGTLTAVTSSNGGIIWTATFTPFANIDDTSNVISLNLALITDLAGNAGVGTAVSRNYKVRTRGMDV